MRKTETGQGLDSHSVRQTEDGSTRRAGAKSQSADQSASPTPLLLTDEQAAQLVFGISRRKFHELREQPWMPKPIVLGARLVRWSRVELERAVANMPRQEHASEPAQLRRGRIEAMKRGSSK